MISAGGPIQVIELGSASGKSEAFTAWIKMRMQVVVVSLGSGSSFDWTSTMDSELTGTDRSVHVQVQCRARNMETKGLTRMRGVFKSSPYLPV